jgi:hypothetical protein
MKFILNWRLFLANMNCLGKKWFVSDGAPVMVGKSNGVAAKFKKKKNEGIRGKDFFL